MFMRMSRWTTIIRVLLLLLYVYSWSLQLCNLIRGWVGTSFFHTGLFWVILFICFINYFCFESGIGQFHWRCLVSYCNLVFCLFVSGIGWNLSEMECINWAKPRKVGGEGTTAWGLGSFVHQNLCHSGLFALWYSYGCKVCLNVIMYSLLPYIIQIYFIVPVLFLSWVIYFRLYLLIPSFVCFVWMN